MATNYVMAEKINGFSMSEIFELYRFAEIYESEIKGQKVNGVAKRYRNFSKKNWRKITEGLVHKQLKEVVNHTQEPLINTLWDNSTYIARDHVVKHIRNAFAHFSLRQDSKSSRIWLTDMYYETKTGKHQRGDISAKYSFDNIHFWKIIQIFTQP